MPNFNCSVAHRPRQHAGTSLELDDGLRSIAADGKQQKRLEYAVVPGRRCFENGHPHFASQSEDLELFPDAIL